MKKIYDKVNLLTKNEKEQNTRINNLSFDLMTELISSPRVNVENILTPELVLETLSYMRKFIKNVINYKIPSLDPSEDDFIKWFETFINVSIQTGFMNVNNY